MPNNRKRNKLFKFLIKLVLSFVLIYMVFSKIELGKVVTLIKTSNYLLLGLAVLMILIAQVFGGLRMNYYTNREGMPFSKSYSIYFYFIGMLFNIILPGGIGGDGYKAYYFQKRYRYAWQKTLMVILRGRASGLLLLFCFLFIFAYLYHHNINIPYIKILIPVCAVLIFPAYSICSKILLREDLQTQIGAFKYSIVVQIFYLFTIIAILYSITDLKAPELCGYIVVFLIANIVAIIPISFGGIGLREFTYMHFAVFFGLDSGVGVTASLLFYFCYTFTSLLGFFPYLKLDKLDMQELPKHKKAIVDKINNGNSPSDSTAENQETAI